MTVVERANVDGLYPRLFYGALSIFASEDVQTSTLVIRLVNSLFTTLVLSATFFLLPRALRSAYVIAAVITAVPLGLFVYGSTNPSSWAMLSASTVWVCIYATFKTAGWRRNALAAFAVFGAVLGSGARADAAAYAVLGAALGLFLGMRGAKRALFPGVVFIVITAIAAAFYLTAGQGSAVVGGLDSSNSRLPLSGHLSNFLNIPDLWRGALGGWPLGWFDTPLPALVSFVGVVTFGAVLVVGFGRAFRRQTIALAIAIVAMWFVPFLLLARSNTVVGDLVQPRYILPLMVITAGVAALRPKNSNFWAGRAV
ncbi:hypothetical protein DC31_09570 [Microbacterium sp. CH12i]|nr:hypothetical protein DC31_09570 [Microbacterium sp. CH12i]